MYICESIFASFKRETPAVRKHAAASRAHREHGPTHGTLRLHAKTGGGHELCMCIEPCTNEQQPLHMLNLAHVHKHTRKYKDFHMIVTRAHSIGTTHAPAVMNLHTHTHTNRNTGERNTRKELPTCMRQRSRSQMASSRSLDSGLISRQSFSWYSAPQISSTLIVSSPTCMTAAAAKDHIHV